MSHDTTPVVHDKVVQLFRTGGKNRPGGEEIKMWKTFLLVVCAAGISMITMEVPSETEDQTVIRRFACPVGFFRLKRFCYYLSAGVASWKEAYFHCRDRNSSLAELERNGKDKTLRRYLMGEQFTKLERWIGGIYNWRLMVWEWGVRGEKMEFQNFAKPQRLANLAWHCTVLDPSVKYKWDSRSCYDRKHYVCQAPAGRIARRRKKMTDSVQNQRLKPRNKGKTYYLPKEKKSRRGRKRNRENWTDNNSRENEEWAHGVKLGSRPPRRWPLRGGRTRHRLNETLEYRRAPELPAKVEQTMAKGWEYNGFPGDSSNRKPQAVGNSDNVLMDFQSRINDIAREEILLRP